MFDRIGRIADETPFVVEWFVKNGIRVWSTQEGEQRFDSHTDKLTNYIRFWQADGESEKTSIRTRTSLGQMVEDGHYKGGSAPYGYELVKSGRINKRKHECYDLAINETEAVVVQLIYKKYVNEGYGTQRISTYLNNLGYTNRKGKNWHPASIRGILCNLTYTGVLRSGESRSEVLEHLKVIDMEMFEAADKIRNARSHNAAETRTMPLNTKGQSLLAGNIFCGHCGSRMTLTTSGKYYARKDGGKTVTYRIRYVHYGKTRKQTECNGQTGYTMKVLDGMIDTIIKKLFTKMKNIPKGEAIGIGFQAKMAERQALLSQTRSEYMKAQKELETLKQEVVKAIHGESHFTSELLSELIAAAAEKSTKLQAVYDAAQIEYDNAETLLSTLKAKYTDIVSWADMYDTAPIEAKKMIVSQLIERVDVFSDYKLHIKFTIDIEQFNIGLEDIGFDLAS